MIPPATIDPAAYDPHLSGTTTGADLLATRADLGWARRELQAATAAGDPARIAEFTERVEAMTADLAWETADQGYREQESTR